MKKDGTHIGITDIIPQKELRDLLRHYTVATGFNARAFDAAGGAVCCPDACAPMPLCRAVQRTNEGRRRCAQSYEYGGEKSAELGEPYIYAGHCGLILCSVPVTLPGQTDAEKPVVAGSIACGPVLLWENDDAARAEIAGKLKDLGVTFAEVKSCLPSLKEIACTNMQSAAMMLMAAVNMVRGSAVRDLEQRRSLSRQQTEIAALLQSKKRAEEALNFIEKRATAQSKYPLEKERLLIADVQSGDLTAAKKILNELLGDIFYRFSGNLDSIKAQLFELMSVISRAAVDAGAPYDDLSELLSEFNRDLGGMATFDEICFATTQTLEHFLKTVYTSKSTSATAQHLTRAVRFIRENYGEDIRLETVAKHIYVSTFYLSHLFRSELGTTFLEYLTRIRIEEAKKQLKNLGDKVSTIALRCGYVSPAYFAKQFKKIVGVTPEQFRK